MNHTVSFTVAIILLAGSRPRESETKNDWGRPSSQGTRDEADTAAVGRLSVIATHPRG